MCSWKGQQQHTSYQHLTQPTELCKVYQTSDSSLQVAQDDMEITNVLAEAPGRGGLLGLGFPIPASGGLMQAVPCGMAAPLHCWASREMAPGHGCSDPLVPAALGSHTVGCRIIKIFLHGWYLCKTIWIMLLLSWNSERWKLSPYFLTEVVAWVGESLTIWMQLWCDHLSCIYPGTWSQTKCQSAKTRQR